MKNKLKNILIIAVKFSLQMFYGSFLSNPILYILKLTSQTGIGSNKCLKYGFLPVAVHYYSPLPDLKDLEKQKVWDKKSNMPGIDFNEKNQLNLLNKLGKQFGKECDWPLNPTNESGDYYIDNNSFGFGCAASLHTIIREMKPKNIIEIGSGNSSKIISSAIKLNKTKTNYIVVDPYPPKYLTKKKINFSKILKKRVELLDASFFSQLKKDDILFIDSSHSVKIGGDVNFLYLEVLPKLNPGVIVHIHDIEMPREYPKAYATNEAFRQFWTEQYLLQAFLVFNSQYEIILALSYLMRDHLDEFKKAFPYYDPKIHKAISGSFWMRKK